MLYVIVLYIHILDIFSFSFYSLPNTLTFWVCSFYEVFQIYSLFGMHFLVQYSQSYYYITVKSVSESECIRTFLSWTKMAITQSILKLGHPGGWGQVEEDNDDEDNNDEYDDNYKADNNNNNIFLLSEANIFSFIVSLFLYVVFPIYSHFLYVLHFFIK